MCGVEASTSHAIEFNLLCQARSHCTIFRKRPKVFWKTFLKGSVTVTFRKAWAPRWYLQASKEVEPVGLKMLSPTLGVLVRTIYEISGYPVQQLYELSAPYCHGAFYNCTKCRQLKWTNSTSPFSSHFYPGYFSLLWSRNPLPPKNLGAFMLLRGGMPVSRLTGYQEDGLIWHIKRDDFQ